MTLDIGTILHAHIVTSLVCLLVTFLLWRENRARYQGVGFWAVGFAFELSGVMLIALRGRIPDVVSMVVANLLGLTGAVLVYEGLARFLGRGISRAFNAAVLAVFTAVQFWFAVVEPDLPTRNLIISLVLLIICVQCVRLLWFAVSPALRSFTRIPGAVFLAYCALCVVRIVDYIVLPSADIDYLRAGTFENVVLLALVALHIANTYALALMVNRRLLATVASQEAKFKKAFHSSPYAITLSRLDDGLLVEVNDGFVRMTGLPREAAVGRTAFDLRLWENEGDRGRLVDELVKAGTVRDMETRFRVREGDLLDCQISADLVDVDRTPHVLMSISDVTERKRLERDRRNEDARLRQHQKLESIGTLASGVAHEINNPMNVIMNYGQLILDDSTAPAVVHEYAANIVRESERISAIVRNLLGFSRQDNDLRIPGYIHAIVGHTTSLVRTILARDRITLTNDVPENLPALPCRAQQIQQVLMNLLMNARDALIEGGGVPEDRRCIGIRASLVDRNAGRWLRVTVEDTGRGIPPEVADRVFDPFFSTKPRDKGTGLGLSISFGIVKEHGGELSFETEVGRGTRFHVDLPYEPAVRQA